MPDSFEAVYERLSRFAKMLSENGATDRKEVMKLLEQVLEQMKTLRHEYTNLLNEHLEELTKTYQEVATLFELNSIFANVVDPSEVLETLSDVLRQTIPFKAIVVELTVLGKKIGYEKSFDQIDSISVAKDLLDTLEGVVLVEPDHGMKVKNLLSVPVRSGGTSWGRITLIERDNGIFTAADRKMLEAAAFQLAATCERYTRLWREIERQRIREQLEIARRIQMNLLPKRLPSSEHFEIAASMTPAMQVGGDYYDVIPVRGCILVTVADIFGKGIPAALLMTSLRSTLRVLAKNSSELSHLANELNNVLCDDLSEDRFVTIVLMCLHRDGRVCMINAGHNPILLMHSDEVSLIEAHELPMGIMRDVDYREIEIGLHPNDTLLIYTDGVTEARNETGEEFGLERLMTVVKSSREVSADEIITKVQNELKRFCGEAPQHDDSTMLVVKYLRRD
ncbi:MAG: PP2C family protein-serine/threonine phosphatase [Thermotoga caldifontis]|uniref:PP2C family protein-serine/threonine phosphatase n=1 Tax=Thermotoga caldifontis TaxID=1508419 RepID=UPI003C7B6D89